MTDQLPPADDNEVSGPRRLGYQAPCDDREDAGPLRPVLGCGFVSLAILSAFFFGVSSRVVPYLSNRLGGAVLSCAVCIAFGVLLVQMDKRRRWRPYVPGMWVGIGIGLLLMGWCSTF